MLSIAEIICGASVFFIGYVFFGYGICLRILLFLKRISVDGDQPELMLVPPTVTVLLTVSDEVSKVEGRLDNLFSLQYPKDKLQIVVASDGSTDGTNELVQTLLKAPTDKLVVCGEKNGKTAAQNASMLFATGEIVVLTDVDSRFSIDFLIQMIKVFQDPSVGGATSPVLFTVEDNPIASAQGYYWRYEQKLRHLESSLGFLAVASGQCLAFRKGLFREMPNFVGDDCVIPLDIVSQGYKFVNVVGAIATDVIETDPQREFRSRVRMTQRNWTGTWRYPHLLNPLRFPGVAFGLWSHKILRWLSPFYILIGSGAVFVDFLVNGASIVFGLWVALVVVALGRAIVGGAFIRVPAIELFFSFLVANAGFLFGVCKAVMGRRITSYKAGQ